jgi:hypothetical protein
MDMPELYSLVLPDGQEYDGMLTEESSSSKAGYASSAQARLMSIDCDKHVITKVMVYP